jgi:hypothetical protein
VGRLVLNWMRHFGDRLDSPAYFADIVRFAYGGVEGCNLGLSLTRARNEPPAVPTPSGGSLRFR